MIYARKYGRSPYTVAAVHGGPGAPGSLAPVARELSRYCGVIEHLESARTVDGQVRELLDVLREHGQPPVTLIGHSWGAWLIFIFAARYPQTARKLILVGSGPFEERYAAGIMDTRLARLSEEEKQQARALIASLQSPGATNRTTLFSLYGALMSKADAFDPLPGDRDDIVEFQENVYQEVWLEAMRLRQTRGLMALAKDIRCPVVAIHGDYDPHPAEGVKEPLGRALKDFRFVLLEKCGHEPWKERAAAARFYEILREELK
ncbi:MAG: Alpha/beta hydrolase family protein [Methanocella sp. PtaU1.Bin125]|nr:MAG: Alpha/beta hydrolase family protein [Methanocella sp. PtaU1.Bin125]